MALHESTSLFSFIYRPIGNEIIYEENIKHVLFKVVADYCINCKSENQNVKNDNRVKSFDC